MAAAKQKSRRKGFPLIGVDQVGMHLYHGTSVVNAAAILASDRMIGVEDEEGEEYAGVSLSNCWERVHGYAKDKTNQLVGDFAEGGYPDTAGLTKRHAREAEHDAGAIFVFDAKGLVASREVRGVVWQKSSPPEERVIGDLDSVQRHLVRVVVEAGAIEAWIDRHSANADLPVERFAGTFFGDAPEHQKSSVGETLAELRALAKHPKVVIVPNLLLAV